MSETTTLHRITNYVQTGQFRLLLLELVIVVVGILIGFQVDRWYEGIREQQEAQQYMERLLSNVAEDINDLQAAARSAGLRLANTELLVRSLHDEQEVLADPYMFILSVEQAIYRNSLVPNDSTYQELLNTGDMALLPVATREALYRYYGQLSQQGQFNDGPVTIQEESFRRFAGVLTPELMDRSILNPDSYFRERAYTESDARGAVERLRNNPAAVAWLPRLRQAHIQEQLQSANLMEYALDLQQHLQSALGIAP